MLKTAEPVASIIVSTCRLEEHARTLVVSLLEQQGVGPFEVLLVDNSGSNTFEREVEDLASSSESVLRCVPELKPGLHNARHRGAAEAASENLIFLDDDVVLPEDWLRGMCGRLADPDVAMVGGRILLRFERRPPGWVASFRGLLSELDLGSKPRRMTADEAPFGCNLAIRRSLLFRVGGFNPDAFADPKLLRYRGDGEVGLAKKIQSLDLPIWYEPTAWLEHLVPEQRLSPDYVEWRSMIGGIEQAYVSYRYYPRPAAILLYRALRSFFQSMDLARRAGADPFQGPETVSHYIQSRRHRSCARHHLRQFASRKLRQWTLQDGYLPHA